MKWREENLAEGVRLICGDCREILPTLGKVDAVVDNSDAVVFNQTHEKPAKRQPRAPAKGDGFVASPQGGDNGSVCDGRPITGADGGTLRRDASGLPEGTCKAGYSTEVARPGGSSERSLQGWDAIDGLSGNDREDALQPLRGDRGATDPSSGRGAYEQHAGDMFVEAPKPAKQEAMP